MHPERDEDDFDDAVTADLLRRWGRHVRAPTHRRAPSPDVLTELHRALDRVDAETAGSGAVAAASPPERAPVIPHWALAAAASVVLLVAAGLLWRTERAVIPPPVVRDLQVSLQGITLRGADELRVLAGEPLELDFELDRPGWVFLALLDGELRLQPVAPGVVHELPAGANRLRLSAAPAPGRVAYLVLASGRPLAPAAFRQVVAEEAAAVSARTPPATLEAGLDATLQALRARPELTAAAATVSIELP